MGVEIIETPMEEAVVMVGEEEIPDHTIIEMEVVNQPLQR